MFKCGWHHSCVFYLIFSSHHRNGATPNNFAFCLFFIIKSQQKRLVYAWLYKYNPYQPQEELKNFIIILLSITACFRTILYQNSESGPSASAVSFYPNKLRDVLVTRGELVLNTRNQKLGCKFLTNTNSVCQKNPPKLMVSSFPCNFSSGYSLSLLE